MLSHGYPFLPQPSSLSCLPAELSALHLHSFTCASLPNLWLPWPRTCRGGAGRSRRQRVASRTGRGRAAASFLGAERLGRAAQPSTGMLEEGDVAEHGRERRHRWHRYPVSGVGWRRKCLSDAGLEDLLSLLGLLLGWS
jgi:hypothetical protein